ncbi:MAG TPA: TadE/TadG family type IV pilus assembly protein [Aliidongia sp.]|nr:TadE/TadG family type IV pilus assembly protein [Aliidongia sp.]
MAKVARFLRNDDGGPAVEMGLIAPLLVAVMLGIVTYGMVIFQIIGVNAAAQAGAMYAFINIGASTASIEAAETAATQLTITTPAPTTLSCGCASGLGLVSVTCGTVCADGTTAGTYLTVNASHATLELVSFLPTVNGRSIVRIQ